MEQKIIESELSQELVDALQEKEQEAIQLLGIAENEAPKEVVNKIRKFVDELLSKNESEEELREYALQLGSLWGSMVVKGYNWKWSYLDFGDDVKGIYLVSPNALYSCPPLYFLTKILLGNNAGLDGNNDNTVMLLYNMMDGIEVQKPPHNYQVIS